MPFALDLTAVAVLIFVISSMTKIGALSRPEEVSQSIEALIEYAGKEQ